MARQHDHDPDEPSPGNDTPSLPESGLGSGLLAQQPTPTAEEAVPVAKVCPQCGNEYETGDRFCPKDGTPLRPKTAGDPLIGRVIADRYLVIARLGEGGMGRVYLAEHVKMNRQCAVKVMNPQLVNDAESLQRFAREASSAARILHPNVAAVFDYGEADKIVYLVMEYVDGESLSEILGREHKLEPRRAIELARQIADGLHAAHELGIVHRDLKPDNVIVARTRSGKEVPKVVDFGIAKAVTDSPQDALTRSGLVIGTPEYMSPEQLLGDPVDARADIYSLGCILYQMLTGVPAFAAESREQMIRRRLHEAAPHVHDVAPELPRRLDTLIAHMLARSPKDRTASAAEVRDALDPALALGGWDPSAITVAAPAQRPSDPALQPTMPMPKQRTSATRIVVGVVIGAVVVLGGAAIWSRVSTPRAPAPRKLADSTQPLVVAPDTATKKPELIKLDSSTLRPKAPPVPDAAFAAPLQQLTKAMSSGDANRVASAFPGISSDQRQMFENLFANAGHVRASAAYGTPVITGDHATMSYTVTLRYSYKTGQSVVTPLHYNAAFERRADKWQLVSLQSK